MGESGLGLLSGLRIVDKHKTYLLTLAVSLLSTVSLLAALDELRLDVYLSLYAVCYFVSSAVFRPRRRFGDIVGGILFLVFFGIVGFRIVEILIW